MKPGSVVKGIGIGVLLTVAGIALCFLLFAPSLILIGVIQAVWMCPAILFYSYRDEKETFKGLLIVTGLVFLLNASCWGILMSGNFRFGG